MLTTVARTAGITSVNSMSLEEGERKEPHRPRFFGDVILPSVLRTWNVVRDRLMQRSAAEWLSFSSGSGSSKYAGSCHDLRDLSSSSLEA